MLLMCKDNAVFNIEIRDIINFNLLPGYIMRHGVDCFKHWLKLRYSSNANTLARRLKGVLFGQGNRVLIDKETHILSLSDCYWLKEEDSSLRFKDVSPYYSNFWKGSGEYHSGDAIPTLYVVGYLSKEWASSEYLYKYGDNLYIEAEVSRLCKICNIPVCDIEVIKGGIKVKNFTNPDVMLEQADESGLIDSDDFTEIDIIKNLGKTGAQIIIIDAIIIDAIIGNGDRHAGNFGWLRDSNTGRYIGVAPLYDFDYALGSCLEKDRLITDAVSCIVGDGRFVEEARRICSIDTNEIFKKRSKTISNILIGAK